MSKPWYQVRWKSHVRSYHSSALEANIKRQTVNRGERGGFRSNLKELTFEMEDTVRVNIATKTVKDAKNITSDLAAGFTKADLKQGKIYFRVFTH